MTCGDASICTLNSELIDTMPRNLQVFCR